MIRVEAGQVDKVLGILKRKRKVSKDIMIVSGRADICVILSTTITNINKIVIDLKNINEIVSTETLIEVEVDLGW
jgi:hypothetical protein|tara:strand:+ start:108 stop:332 length:225 start_codon:yes stop_codon:yes gene_type:complete